MPRSLWFKVFVVLAALWAPFSQADTGWQPIQETIRKSEKDTRQYQAIRLDNDMVVLLVSDPQAVKSLSALVVPVGSLQDPADHQGLAHFLEHMTLMGSQKYPQPDSLAEFLKLHGGSHNASTAPYRTAFYLEVENDALDGAVDRLADAIAAPLLDKKYADRERNAVNAELTMARTRDGMRMARSARRPSTRLTRRPTSRVATSRRSAISPAARCWMRCTPSAIAGTPPI